jgi:acyl-homoserine lactone acylase PvdQ
LNFQVFSQTTSTKKGKTRKAATQVTIIRDNWNYIPHVYGKQMLMPFLACYTQCEDDFLRIEMNYIEKLGRLSEIKGNPFYIMIWKQD